MRLTVFNPFDQSIVCELPYDDSMSIDRKLGQAVLAQDVWRRLPLEKRIEQIELGLSRFKQQSERIACDISLQMGKPIAQSRKEVETFFDRARHMIAIAPQALAARELPKEGFIRRIEHEPLGVVLDLAAWNYPLLTAVNVVVPALLAGNTVLLKHSGQTPLCGQAFEEAFGFLNPRGLLAWLVLTHDGVNTLIQDPRIAHVSFTGSVGGGRQIQAAAAHRFIDVGLELGGKDPAYVAEDADLDVAVANIVDGACYNAGQSCCSVERVYVHQKHYEAFLEKALPRLKAYQLGNPLEESTTMGPLANASAIDELEQKIQEAQKMGARLLLGGKRRVHGSAHFFEPTLIADVTNEMRLMQEENFAPIVAVQAVMDDAEALELMNNSAYGLTASVWTKNMDRAARFAQDLQAGTIFANRCDYLDPALAWTGVKDSGKGSTLSEFGFMQLTRRKSIHFRK